MFCKKCGKQIPDDANFCPYCGEHLNGKLPTQQTSYSRIFIVICIIFGLITLGYIGFGKNSTPQETSGMMNLLMIIILPVVFYLLYKLIDKFINRK